MPFSPVAPGDELGIGIFIFCSEEPWGLGEADGICMPGIFICVCGDVDGEGFGICMPGIFICVCGDGDGEAFGICIPGMFISIFWGEPCGAAGCFGDEALAGKFIPGMLRISVFFPALSCAGAFLIPEVALPRCIPRIFIPGMFIPCMLLMSCFFAVCFLGVGFLFFRVVAFDLDFDLGLLIPDMLDMSCCARTGKLATNRKVTKTTAQTLRLKRKSIALTFFIISPRKTFPRQRSLLTDRQLQQEQKDLSFSENERTRSSLRI